MIKRLMMIITMKITLVYFSMVDLQIINVMAHNVLIRKIVHKVVSDINIEWTLSLGKKFDLASWAMNLAFEHLNLLLCLLNLIKLDVVFKLKLISC